MALSNTDEGLVLEFLSQKEKSMDCLTDKVRRDLEKIIPVLRHMAVSQENAAECIDNNRITLKAVVDTKVVSSASLYSPARTVVREFIEWYGKKYDRVIPDSAERIDKMEQEISILRRQLKNRVSYDAEILDRDIEIKGLNEQIVNLINENNLLKKRIRSLENTRQKTKQVYTNVLPFIPTDQ